MVPRSKPRSPRCSPAPRARGDGPLIGPGSPGDVRCSPPARGWSRDEALAELTTFRTLAVSRLTAQSEEIERLREQAAAVGKVHRLPAVRSDTAPYGSWS
ncbi:hypothetical protein OHS70_38645 (plasmid) [Streptomyces sp. NBC_00390]|uniref:hypothetical protein n=1 Tax=Streptomyces sp. NBC_00390 TaxID=2975736 RepID=UPI002E245FE1